MQPVMSFTAVYLKSRQGYVGFVEELPGVVSQGNSLDEARRNLRRFAEVVFNEDRKQSKELVAGKDVLREPFVLPLPPAAPASFTR